MRHRNGTSSFGYLALLLLLGLSAIAAIYYLYITPGTFENPDSKTVARIIRDGSEKPATPKIRGKVDLSGAGPQSQENDSADPADEARTPEESADEVSPESVMAESSPEPSSAAEGIKPESADAGNSVPAPDGNSQAIEAEADASASSQASADNLANPEEKSEWPDMLQQPPTPAEDSAVTAPETGKTTATAENKPDSVVTVNKPGPNAETMGTPALPESGPVQEIQPGDDATAKASGKNPEPDGSLYVINVLSTENEEKARNVLDILKKTPYLTYTYQAEVKGRNYYRIRIGFFSTFEEAFDLGKRLASEHHLPEPWITVPGREEIDRYYKPVSQ